MFQRAYRLSLELHRVSLNWPRVEQYGRRGRSGCGAPPNRFVPFWSRVPAGSLDRMLNSARYLSMAIGSADEVRLWCDYAADLELRPCPRSLAWQDELSQIARMLHGLRRTNLCS